MYMCGGERGKAGIPLGIGYLMSNSGHNIQYVTDRKHLNNCDLIGLSSGASGLKEAVSILESTKIPIVLGGQGTLWGPILDYPFKHVVVGEGEIPLMRIIEGSDARIFYHLQIKDIDCLAFPKRRNVGDQVSILTSRGCPWSCKFCSAKKQWNKVRMHSADYFLSEVEHIIKKYPQAKSLYIVDDLFTTSKKRLWEIKMKWCMKGFH